jgi:probable aminopeptidase NPEPL1
MSRLSFVSSPDAAAAETLVVIGRVARLLADDVRRALPPALAARAWEDMVKRGDAGDTGRIATTYTGGAPHKVAAIVLPEPCGRHNSASRAWAISPLLTSAGLKGQLTVIAALDDANHAFAVASAIGRAFPTWAASPRPEREIKVAFLAPDRAVGHLDRLSPAVEGTRKAAEWTDRPPDRLNCDALVAEAEAIARAIPGVSIQVWRGAELAAHGLNGLYAVGKCAVEAPALVALEWAPKGASKHHGWVGKGIVYDTGGLALKPKASMAGMKTDMAGAAAVLAAFEAAARLGSPDRITAVLAIAENAIGPGALRPDDIVAMYSGRTVEINNPDAEGRLVLGDAAAWLARTRSPDEIWTLATLTGAQSISTGKRHAAIYATDDEIERRAVIAGRASGDTAHPLPYCPEFWRREFASPVADMKNSVKDRENGQSACAAQFIGNHLAAVGWSRPWCHVDMAAPAVSSGRGTGFGVGLLLTAAGLGAPMAAG